MRPIFKRSLHISVWLLFFVLIPVDKSKAQANKTFSLYQDTRIGHRNFYQVNDVVLNDTALNIIKTHYPRFDTIYLEPRDPAKTTGRFVITRFKPGEKYAVVPSCCTSSDIVEASRLDEYFKQFELHYNGDSISRFYGEFLTRVTVRFSARGPLSNDTLLGVFDEWAGFPFGVILQKKPSEYYEAPKGFYWNNITTVSVARLTKHLPPSPENKAIIDPIWIEDIQVLKYITFRFFRNEKLHIVYYTDTGKLDMQLE